MNDEKRNTLRKVLQAAIGAGGTDETSADVNVETAIEKFQMSMLPKTFHLQTFWNTSEW